MTVQYIAIPDNPDARPTLAIALRMAAKQGLSVQYTGICRFDLTQTRIEQVVAEIASPGFKWKEPKFGKMKSALTIGVDQPETVVIFVLDDSLDAEFSDSVPALFVADDASAQQLCNVRIWQERPGQYGGATIASVTTLFKAKKSDVEFAIALDNVGVTHPDRQPYRTPIIIDPDMRHPPEGGGVGGGGPP
jgi:hypothetical protein